MSKNTPLSVSAHQTVVAHTVIAANTFLKRLKGLMGQKALAEGHALWLSPCNSIHSFFMRFTFDAVFLDAEHTIVYLRKAMPPGQLSPLYPKAKTVLELPSGRIDACKLCVGDTLRFEPKTT